METYVKKANSRQPAIPQRDAFNEAMNSVALDEGTFDLKKLLIDHPDQFSQLISLIEYYRTGDDLYISPTDIYIRAVKKYEDLFRQMERPAFEAIKQAVESGVVCRGLNHSKVKGFFMKRAVLSDLPENLRPKALLAAKQAHGDGYDTKSLEEDEAPLNTLLTPSGKTSIFFFDIKSFEFRK